MTLISLNNLSKSYAGAPALCDVSLALRGGRVHALMGENGAGKSTLIKLIAGVVRADAMTVELEGMPVALSHAQDAQAAGFRFIHQELNIVPQISVAENILLGQRFPRRFGVAIDWPAVRAAATQALATLGADHIDVRALAGDLPAGEKMLIKIAAALVSDGEAPVLYVLDEPTAALTGAESEMLFDVIARLKARGAAVLYVSHRLDEVLRICDDVTVLRDGRHVSTGPVAATSKAQIIHDMTGRAATDAYPVRTTPIGEQVVATIRDVRSKNLNGLNFDLHEGEILGITGLSEAGQSQLLQMFLGQERALSGTATFHDAPLPRTPAQAWDAGVAYIPRERRAEGLMLERSIRDNIVLPHLSAYGALANTRAETRDASNLAAKTRLKYDAPDQPVGQLSGGNQQKVVFARALHGTPRLLLLDEPTRGVDVGAKFDIYTLVRELSAKGCPVILTSSDLPEILGMCDRVLVLQDGRQAHFLEAKDLQAVDLLSYFYTPEAAQ
ncbi:sugar ABC transporter ATP-binding protein [Gymnodinialimonas sp.]